MLTEATKRLTLAPIWGSPVRGDDDGDDRRGPRAAYRCGACVQPLLYAADRRAARASAGKPVPVDGCTRALRAGALAQNRRPTDRERARCAAHARRRVFEPLAPQLRAARPGAQEAFLRRREPKVPCAFRTWPAALRFTGCPVAGGGRGDPRQAFHRGTVARGRSDAEYRRTARSAAGRCTRAADALRTAAASTGRHRLDRPPPRRPLRAGIRLRRTVRGAGGRDRRALRRTLRSEARTVLDCRARWRDRRLRFPRAQDQDSRQATTAAGRARGPRARHRQAPYRRVCALPASRRLSQADALDTERPPGRAPPLCNRPIPQSRQGG